MVNYGVAGAGGLTAEVEILNLDGSVAWRERAEVDSAYDSTVSPITLEFPEGLSPVHFLRLRLRRGSQVLSRNLYWRGRDPADYRALRTIPEVTLQVSTDTGREEGEYRLRTILENSSGTPALGIRLVVVGSESSEPLLPVFHDDNFLSLMPGETRTIESRLQVQDTRGEEPRILVEGFNVTESGE